MMKDMMVYLDTEKAELVKYVGVNPIYQYNNKYYVGVGECIVGNSTVEYCCSCLSINEATFIAKDANQCSK